MAVIIVLAILSITLALSYSVMRTQVTAVQIQTNAGRRGDARQAAMAGVSVALRTMHEPGWNGADSTLAGVVGPGSGYHLTFATGDDSLAAGDADYAEWPYRVTVTSTGYAADPASPQLRSEHTVRVVMQLIRRGLSPEPAGWQAAQSYVVYQWKPTADVATNNRFLLEYPSRINGRVRLQGGLSLCAAYPEYDSARQQLLSDLNLKRLAGQGDTRPLTGRVDLPSGYTTAATLLNLTVDLAVATLTVPQSTAADWTIVDSPTYRLYEGGREFTVPDCGSTLKDVNLAADPQTNPLGLFYHYGQVDIHDNVTLRGTLIVVGGSGANVNIDGANVLLEGIDLAPLDGAAQPVQLPVLVIENNLRIRDKTDVAINGMAVVNRDLQVDQAPQAGISLAWRGRLICQELLIYGRNEWNHDSNWYRDRLSEFELQKLTLGTPYFPDFLKLQYGLDPAPRIAIQGPASPVSYHWPQYEYDPLLEPGAGDDALLWDLVDWKDVP